jgi:uncharacterized protein
MKLQTHWLETPLNYDGTQLRSHFIYQCTGILGNSCLGFIGGCEVGLDHLVDLEDVRRKAPIYSPRMLHFLLEDFHLDLAAGVLLQRLMVSMVAEELVGRGVQGLQRRGDDLYWQEKKLNVSIATRSSASTLIHLGINIDTERAPVPAVGLAEWDIAPEALAKSFMKKLEKEYGEIWMATYKVREVD